MTSETRNMETLLENERAVLGCIILDNEKIYDVQDILVREDFLSNAHKIIFDAMNVILKKGKVIDELSLRNCIDANKKIQHIGGVDYLMNLAKAAPTPENVCYYAEIVRKASTKRQLHTILQENINNLNKDESIIEMITNLQSKLDKVSDDKMKSNSTTMNKLLIKEFDILEAKQNGTYHEVEKLPTGYDNLDAMLAGGMCLGWTTILAGRPAMGKTSFIVSLLRNISRTTPSLFLSIEMTKSQITRKYLAQAAHVPENEIWLGKMDQQKWDDIYKHIHAISRDELYIDDHSRTYHDVMNSIRKHIRLHNVKFICIDYLQRVNLSGKDFGSRHLELGSFIDDLAYLAKNSNVNILAISQLNRQVESRTDKRPVMSDLSESGRLEEVADRDILMYRDEYYNPGSKERGVVEIIVGKNKFGASGIVKMNFNNAYTSFSNYIPRYNGLCAL